jgi:hypothetical protein
VTSPPPVNKPSPSPGAAAKKVTDLTGDKPAPLMERKPNPGSAPTPPHYSTGSPTSRGTKLK